MLREMYCFSEIIQLKKQLNKRFIDKECCDCELIQGELFDRKQTKDA